MDFVGKKRANCFPECFVISKFVYINFRIYIYLHHTYILYIHHIYIYIYTHTNIYVFRDIYIYIYIYIYKRQRSIVDKPLLCHTSSTMRATRVQYPVEVIPIDLPISSRCCYSVFHSFEVGK